MTVFSRSHSPSATRTRCIAPGMIRAVLLLALACLLTARGTAAFAAVTDLGAGLSPSPWTFYVSNYTPHQGSPFFAPIPAGWMINQDANFGVYQIRTEPPTNYLQVGNPGGSTPYQVTCALPLGLTEQHPAWAINMCLYVQNLFNATVSSCGDAPHCQADPNIVVADDQGNPLARLEWKVTDNSDPAQVKCELLLNGQPVIPATYGMLETKSASSNLPSPNACRYIPHYDPAIAGFVDPLGDQLSPQMFLTISGTADGTVAVQLHSAGPNGAIRAAALTPGNIQRPAQLIFNCGGGFSSAGGGEFRLFQRADGTILYATGQMEAVDDLYTATVNTPLTVSAPGVLGNDADVFGVTPTASLVTPPAHGSVTLNADGSFTYTPNTSFYGHDTFTYEMVDGLHTSSPATVTIKLAPPSVDLAADIDFWSDQYQDFGCTNPIPTNWGSSPSSFTNGINWWYGWGVYPDTVPPSLNMISTWFIGDPDPQCPDPVTVWRTLSLNPAEPITGWGVTAKMYVNDVVNTSQGKSNQKFYGSADPRIALEDANGNPIANLEWRVTDLNPAVNDPSQTRNELLLNGATVIPPTYGFRDNGYWSDLKKCAGYDPAIAGWGDHTNNHFDLVLSGAADGHTLVRLNSAGPCGTVIGPSLGALDPAHPARLVFYCGNGTLSMGGGNFQIYYQPNGTLNFYYTHALPVNDTYKASQDTTLTVPAPGVMANDLNPDFADSLTAELVTPPAHGTVVLNADGSFTYTPLTSYTGPDSFTYHLVDAGIAITSTATVNLQVRVPSLVQVVNSGVNVGTGTVQVPITLAAQGDENTLGCSLNFDPAILSNPVVALGADAITGSQLLVNASGAAQGRLGMGIALPVGQTYAAGTRQVAVVTFTVVTNPTVATTSITFGDTPTKRELVSALAQPLGATWQNGSVALNHAPVAQNDTYTVQQNTMLSQLAPGVLANDTDADGNTLSTKLVSSTTHGTLNLHADGSFTYSPVHNYVGTDSFTYQASDTLSLSNTVTVTLTIAPTGYEADVAPRSDGDGQVTMTDWVQIGRYAVGMDTPGSPGEFLRADCAPRNTLGDGKLTVADWVQAGRYAVGLDPLSPAGGPTSASAAQVAGHQAAGKTPILRTVSFAPATLTCGKAGTVQVVLNAQGNESALGFTLNFNPKQVKFVSAKLVGMASNATLNVNNAQASSGHVGIAMMLPLPQTVKAGKQALVEITFQPLTYGMAPLTFGNQLTACEVASSTATVLPATFINGTVAIRK